MSNVKEITSKTINEINAEIKSALKDVEKKFGVQIDLGNSRYTNKNYTTKMKVSVVSEDGQAITREALQFERYRNSGRIPEKFEVGGRIRTPRGDCYIIDGYNSRARKYPVQVHNQDKNVKMSLSFLKQCEVLSY